MWRGSINTYFFEVVGYEEKRKFNKWAKKLKVIEGVSASAAAIKQKSKVNKKLFENMKKREDFVEKRVSSDESRLTN